MILPSASSTAPSVHFTYPPSFLLSYEPGQNPRTLSPSLSDHTLARPFNIPTGLYNNALHITIPITIALVYTTTVSYVNKINKDRKYKPWAFSKSLLFWALVVLHNVFLAVYSGWTFIGMLNAVKQSWPGLDGQYGLAGAADALCRFQGPRGLGSAATYNTSTSAWGFTDKAMKLAGDIPDSTDVGRMWNEGLAFYGWLFYLSKFYEVVDTMIILTKGKKSSLLQTYHHAGAMMCMWAGIRYMSSPIWMFVFINSLLHSIMYTYYALSALSIRVPQAVKQTLTFLQIAQITLGAAFAFAHLFVAYDIPIEEAYLYVHNLSTALPSTASAVSSTISSALTNPTVAAELGSWLKKAALRAAGEEGLAENVRNYQGETFGIDAIHAAEVEKAQEEIKYRMGSQKVHCLDNSGQVLAILMNLVYLTPLAYLFMRYFYKSYIARAHSDPPKPTKEENVKQSSRDAVKNIEREIREAVDGRQGGDTEPPPELKAKLEHAKRNVKENTNDLNGKAQSNAKALGAKAQKGAHDLTNGDLGAKVQNGVKDVKNTVQEDLKALQDSIKKMGGEGAKAKGSQDVKDKPSANGQSAASKRSESPKKSDPSKRSESPKKGQSNGVVPRRSESPKKGPSEKKEVNGDAKAYEVVPDEPKTAEEKKAEEKMQPK
ncbi:MAG: hypothetical protein ASARMPREDX12_006981 [Alectoria sarmentosa]|nr:MAG: hypothetical protein ASARMPREDX12_006981 [Alectoria sarmentosa]